MGMPKAAPMACASSITALQKSRTSGSSRMRSQVAPVRAEIGFMVMLPQSLNQTSRWMRSDSVTAKPAFDSSVATRLQAGRRCRRRRGR